jgi:hypothetical protein
MKRASFLVVVLVLAVAAAIPVLADDDGPIQGYIAGGYTEPLGHLGDYVGGGWNISGGAIFSPSPTKPVAIRFDLGFNTWNATTSAIQSIPGNTGQAIVDGGYANIWTLTGDVLYKFGKPDHVGGYIGLGIGGYRRYAALTNEVLVPGYICDPWWGYCYTAATTGTQTIAHDTLTKFGYNAALGVTFPVGSGEMYLEARYHYMINDPATEFVPILLGYRF